MTHIRIDWKWRTEIIKTTFIIPLTENNQKVYMSHRGWVFGRGPNDSYTPLNIIRFCMCIRYHYHTNVLGFSIYLFICCIERDVRKNTHVLALVIYWHEFPIYLYINVYLHIFCCCCASSVKITNTQTNKILYLSTYSMIAAKMIFFISASSAGVPTSIAFLLRFES